MPKFVFVSGGVISGLGKGITTASLAAILKNNEYNVSAMKVDMYLNQDAGTLRPIEHGEVFVTEDGLETDQDIGNYERFLETSLSRRHYCTTGQVYAEVVRKERAFEYEGDTVEAIPHVTDEIIRRFREATDGSDICIIELGGTVGEYQNGIFFEAARILKNMQPEDVVHVHVAYLPIPAHLGEMKTKTVQTSVWRLNSMGIQPDFIVGRSSEAMDDRRKERVALFCNVKKDHVISAPDAGSIYEIPTLLAEQDFAMKVQETLGLEPRRHDLTKWRALAEKIQTVEAPIKIGVIGKYFATGDYYLTDVYISVIEAIKHAAWAEDRAPELVWIDSTEIEEKGAEAVLKDLNGIVVPGGFGGRGIEGIIDGIRYARENNIPYLGLCYGMQLACIEFARNVVGLKSANTQEVDENAEHVIIHVMPDQAKKMLKRDYGGSMRLGAWDCVIKDGTKAHDAYGTGEISERHRHRYEFNNVYREQLEEKGLVISGTTPDGELVELIEVSDHPFFVATQAHPEFKSYPHAPHPLFAAFMRAATRG